MLCDVRDAPYCDDEERAVFAAESTDRTRLLRPERYVLEAIEHAWERFLHLDERQERNASRVETKRREEVWARRGRGRRAEWRL